MIEPISISKPICRCEKLIRKQKYWFVLTKQILEKNNIIQWSIYHSIHVLRNWVEYWVWVESISPLSVLYFPGSLVGYYDAITAKFFAEINLACVKEINFWWKIQIINVYANTIQNLRTKNNLYLNVINYFYVKNNIYLYVINYFM